ncbi:hypothetical protein OK351_03555 [Glutamicibacter sp. MNS18]|uniref:hypothetical protein n=1 Tax=Glutamicibacter sp. MNS18 TaxID=2989817 RepID=UPI002235F9BA|nr:hypothetical protein [Glutamicibacter sp. MNS18]MCW4464583.1 hypothetical protein [Glutamicibacter sp. MNS18]
MGTSVDDLAGPLGRSAAQQGRTADEYAEALLDRFGNPAGHAGFLSADTASRTCSVTMDLLDLEVPDRITAEWMLFQLAQQLVDEYRATAPALRSDLEEILDTVIGLRERFRQGQDITVQLWLLAIRTCAAVPR